MEHETLVFDIGYELRIPVDPNAFPTDDVEETYYCLSIVEWSELQDYLDGLGLD